MDQLRRLPAVPDKLKEWEQEIEEQGYIKDESSLLTYIRTLSEQDDASELSRLLTLAALSRSGKYGQDSVVLGWMEKAVSLHPKNREAQYYLAENDWKTKQDLFGDLTFPPIRETDNRAAKKKTAEQYIDITRQFLNQAEERLDLVKNRIETLSSVTGSSHNLSYKRLEAILSEAIKQAAELLKASNDYKESISGVFYTSTHYEDMKQAITELGVLKEQWDLLFQQDEKAEPTELDPLEELAKMIGLDTVKQRVNKFYHFLKYQKERKRLGYQIKDELSLNMIFTGNPGTGKTTLARLLAKIYHSLGVLPREEVIEADRSQLVGAYVGQTEENVRKAVERAVGGVLFIDEAYSLKREGQTGNDYGQTAIDTLISLMTGSEYGGKFAVILAGYPEEMRTFLEANPGLRSRFPQSNLIHLPDYSSAELLQIAEQTALDNDYLLTEEARQELDKRIDRERVDETFGNARTVRNLVLEAIFTKGSKESSENDIVKFTLLEKEDVELKFQESNEHPSELLHQLIGLQTVKDDVQTLLSFVQVQQIRHQQGLPAVPIQLHAVFTGNPGTGKTTVAKIYAELLKDYGILKRGHLIVASRADFVAGYVGQTAIKTKKKIREALGGVLFIDEAYSLLGQTPGDFGREVIDTFVDEMTRHNENLVVILAGYPAQMEMLLNSNPGLKSRFKKFFAFPDYTVAEMLEIITNYADRYQYKLTDEAVQFLHAELEKRLPRGNGRFAANLIDEAVQLQAFRLVSETNLPEALDQAAFLRKEDIEKAYIKVTKGE
ncbi:AAA family ATPase [Mesobacillus harenae]|uniref:AAA family ATPase n=1 Tax=Mesobacillus harenae TaxID=2213203 RepID=UPI001580A35E|nr:AAA family ATPase [Mesobacillus harenae]